MTANSLVEARLAANRARAEWLHAVASGVISPTDVIRAAALPDNDFLRNMSLRSVLEAAYGYHVTNGIIIKLRRASGGRLPSKYIPVRWVLDGRGSNRLQLLSEVIGESKPEIHRRFPFA